MVTSLIVAGERIIDRRLAAVSAVADDVRIVSNDPVRGVGLRIPIIPDAIVASRALRARRDRRAAGVTGLFEDVRMREWGPAALAPYDEGSGFETVNTPHDHARARGWLN
jgi:hypothetical protein